MSLHVIRPENETEGLLLSLVKNCEMFSKQSHGKPQKTLEYRLTQPKEVLILAIYYSWS